jgi:hypothetical protein
MRELAIIAVGVFLTIGLEAGQLSHANAQGLMAEQPTETPDGSVDVWARYGIELGTVSKRDGLRLLWGELLTKHSALVGALQPRRVLGPDKKWRLIAGPFANSQDAEGACSLFKKIDWPCATTVWTGDRL